MALERKDQKCDVGVIMARFQVPDLHESHRELIDTVRNDCDRLIIILGLSPLRGTKANTLDRGAREAMIKESYPDATVLYLNNQRDDLAWSKKLDELIRDNTTPTAKVRLYGSRDSFIPHYKGKYETRELLQRSYISGTEVRRKTGHKVPNNKSFREGAIWAIQQRYPAPDCTVDVAITDGTRLLLARKKEDPGYRFVGGYIGCKETAEHAAVRETTEETHLEVGGETALQYLGSCVIDDWRYRGEEHNILTFFYLASKIFGRPEPDDDISELRWFDIAEFTATAHKSYNDIIVPEHVPLMDMFLKRYGNINNEGKGV